MKAISVFLLLNYSGSKDDANAVFPFPVFSFLISREGGLYYPTIFEDYKLNVPVSK